MFYSYPQNNSFGYFDCDDKVCQLLVIEANSQSEADAIAEELGCYFDGVIEGKDCPCCGDRWMHGDLIDMDEWGTVEQYVEEYCAFSHWTKPAARIFYSNGVVKEFEDGLREIYKNAEYIGDGRAEEFIDTGVTPIFESIPNDHVITCKMTIRSDKITMLKLQGLWCVVLDICPNKRVRHLMKHGKNDRVRLKNYYHAVKLIKRYYK